MHNDVLTAWILKHNSASNQHDDKLITQHLIHEFKPKPVEET
jgi:hypothetical protein